jgi:hypothetical protein
VRCLFGAGPRGGGEDKTNEVIIEVLRDPHNRDLDRNVRQVSIVDILQRASSSGRSTIPWSHLSWFKACSLLSVALTPFLPLFGPASSLLSSSLPWVVVGAKVVSNGTQRSAEGQCKHNLELRTPGYSIACTGENAISVKDDQAVLSSIF